MLTVTDVTVGYDGAVAVDRAGLRVADGAIVAVLGPSGSGKTTLLRAIAGLEAVGGGTVIWDGVDLTAVPPHRRDFGLMFQDHALFGHLDVLANVRFGLRMRGYSKVDQVARADAMLELVGLGGLRRRRVDELSGGEQQRVALARALAPRPRLLMLDEPLASVDRERREQLADELQRVIRATGTAALLVTHDLDEAFTLADDVVLLDHGVVIQAGPAATVWRAPATVAAARFLGVATTVTGPVEATTDGAVVATPWGPVPAATLPAATTRAWIGWRPSDVVVDRAGEVAGTVQGTTFRRDHFLVTLATEHGPVTARAATPPAAGSRVRVHADPGAAVVLPAP
ncbi:MAG: ABC transporter ATP-binding protein [Acidimicrobiia bacterium]